VITVSDSFEINGTDPNVMRHLRLISDATADSLLDGAHVDDPPLQDLVQLLAAASAPGRAEELMGQEAAVVAFAAAHRRNLSPGHSRPAFENVVLNSVGLKLATAALAAVAAASVIALAATNGALPDPVHPVPTELASAPVVATPYSPTHAQTRRPQMHNPGSQTPTPSPRTSRPAVPPGWCRQQLKSVDKGVKDKHSLEITAAVDGADVTDYCVALIGSPKAKSSNNTPKAHKSK
jgi:hypothetical protein